MAGDRVELALAAAVLVSVEIPLGRTAILSCCAGPPVFRLSVSFAKVNLADPGKSSVLTWLG